MSIHLYTSAVTMGQLQQKLDTIGNNIANVNTVGFKKREVAFQDLLTREVKNQQFANKEVGRETPYGLRIGHGAKVSQTMLRYEPGSIQDTGRQLDFRIEGLSGFFQVGVLGENGELEDVRFTKDGSFNLQPSGNELALVNAQGNSVLDVNGNPIILQRGVKDINVTNEGTMIVNYEDNQTEQFQLGVAQVNRPDQLQAVGGNEFRLPGDINEYVNNGTLDFIDLRNNDTMNIKQGSLEMSNVDLTTEMTELMSTQRLMQFQARSLSMADEMMGLVNNIRG